MIHPPPNTTLFPYTTLFRSYDKNGRKTKETDANGNATSFKYDESGHVLTVTEANNAVTMYVYDKNGNKTSRSEEHTSELQSHSDLVCRLLLEKKKKTT